VYAAARIASVRDAASWRIGERRECRASAAALFSGKVTLYQFQFNVSVLGLDVSQRRYPRQNDASKFVASEIAIGTRSDASPVGC
jgi:hypothetical protein